VEQRVEELADRHSDYEPEESTGFMRLMPLSEIIAAVIDAGSPSTQAVWKIYTPLINRFGDEFTVLMDAQKEALAASVVDQRIADAIIKVREGKVTVVPGYDGVYGRLVLPKEEEKTAITQTRPIAKLKPPRFRIKQSGLKDFL